MKAVDMRSRQIENINEALLVLRHFIDLSAQLLPLLYTLKQKSHPTAEEELNIVKIQQVYNQYSFDTETSKLLIDSDILALIRNSFDIIKTKNSRSKNHARQNLMAFLNEYNRLKDNWELTVAN